MAVAGAPKRGGARRRKPPASTAVSRSRAQAAGYRSQGAAVARQAYVSAPVPERRRQVRAAKAEYKARVAAALRHTTRPAALRTFRTGSQPETSQILGTHGVRASLPARQRRLQSTQIAQHAYTPVVMPTNRMSAGMFSKKEAFEGFKDYTKRAQQGKLKPEELKRAAMVTSIPHPDAWGKLAKAGLGGTLTATKFASDQLLRPSTAVGAAFTGHSALEGLKHPERNTEYWNAVGKKIAPHSKLLGGAIGLAGSVALDPTTYLTAGTGSLARQGAMRVFEEELARTGSQALAGRAARKFFEETPAHARYAGIKLGVRGTPARIARKVTGGPSRAPVYARPLSGGRVRALGAKHGVLHVPVAGKAANRARTALSAAVRPHDIDEVSWDILHRAGTAGRAGERTAQRHGEAAVTAYHREGLTTEQEAKIARAIEDVHTAAPRADAEQVFAAHGLTPHEANVGHAVRADVLKMAAREGRDVTGPRVGFHEVPRAPALSGALPVSETRAELQAAHRAVKAAERSTSPAELRQEVERARNAVRAATNKLHRETGRRQATEQRIGPQAVPSLGQQHAAEVLDAARTRFKAAIDAEQTAGRSVRATSRQVAHERFKMAKSQHQINLRSSAADRRAMAAHDAELETFANAPKGYVPRTAAPGALTEEAAHRQPTGRGPTGAGTATQKRHLGALKNLTPEQLSKYDPRLDVAMGHRTVESFRRQAATDLNERLAGLGNVISGAEARQLAEAARGGRAHVEEHAGVYIRDAQGIKPAFDKWGHLDAAEIERAANHGQEIIRVDADQMAKGRDLARGSKDPGAREVLGGYRGVTRGLKTIQTQINPSFHLRNLMGDLWNAAGQGARLSDMPDAIRLSVRRHYMDVAEKNLPHTANGRKALAKLAKLDKHQFTVPGYGKMAGTELLGLAERYGAIKTGIGAAELQAAARGDVISDKRLGKRAMNKLAKAGDVREDFGRLISFKRGLEQGLSPERAAQSTLVSHFDYSNLTPAEQRIRDYFIPFWTFFARNTALQVRTLATHPGLYATTEKARRQSLSATGIDPNIGDQLAGFEQQNLPWGTPAVKGVTRFKVGGLTIPVTASPALPYMDLGNLPFPQPGGKHATFSDFINNLASRVNPLFRMPYELANDVNTFTGKQRNPQQGTLVPAPAYFKLLPKEVQKAIGMKTYRDSASGKAILGVPAPVLAATKVAPLPNLASKAGVPGPPGAPNKLGLAVAGWLSGPRYAAQDPRAIQISKLYDQNTILTKQVADLRQRVLNHKPRSDWGGQVKKLNDQITKNNHQIYKLGKQIGIKFPGGTPPAKGRTRRAKMPGGFGAGGFSLGGFGGGGFGQ